MKPRRPACTGRQLAAIIATDFAGYSRLIDANEEGAHGELKSLRAEMIDPRIAARRGQIVKTAGDGIDFAIRLEALAKLGDALRLAELP